MAYGFEKLMKDELSKLTREQRAAVMHGDGGALCIAGPGSGKTRVISLRAARLWDACGNGAQGSSKGAVLTLSFNRPACAEMRERSLCYIKKLGGGEDEPAAGFYTVHAYCFKLVKEYLSGKNMALPKVLGPVETSEIIEKLYSGLSGGRVLPADEMKRLRSYILTENEEPDFEFGGLNTALAVEIADHYRKTKERQGLIDFGDMLSLALKYLREDGRFEKKVREAYRFTQVDEAQDLSGMQAEIIKIIAGENVFYVADDDQSIYGFRGATPGTVKKLCEGGGFKRYMLEKNFRSGANIGSASSLRIKANDDRFLKKISAAGSSCGKVSLRYFPDVKVQAAFCAGVALRRATKGKSVCVLYRNNASGLAPSAALFFEAAKRGKDMTARVRGDRMLFSRLDYVRKIYEAISAREKKSGRREGLFRAGKLPSAIYAELKREKTVDMIAAECFGGRRPFLREAAVTAVDMIISHAGSADHFLKLAGDIDSFCGGEEDSLLNLSTVHSAKGLEFDTVIITDCAEGEFPFGDPRKEEQVREERRLMYVAMTRAENELIITFPGKCGKIELVASRFVEEIAEEL